MPKVEVALGDRTFYVHVERGAAGDVARYLPEGSAFTKAFVVSDENVAALYAEQVKQSFLKAGVPMSSAVIPAGEAEKTLARVEYLYHEMIRAGLDRKSLVVGLGGGVTGDIAGFAAATYMRGIAVLQVPTTIVAQVDSSSGGKTGVDLPEGKNLVGAFHQPVAVVADPETLSTLPRREVLAGLAEVVKHGIIRDEEYFRLLEENGSTLSDVKSLLAKADLAERVILRSVEIKAGVVAADEREAGLRAILNFGHTVGHALESLTGYEKYRHGEAVAVGMVAEAAVAVEMGRASEETVSRIKDLLEAIGLPTGPDGASASAAIEAAGRDKKTVGGRLRLVLPSEIGRVELVEDIDPEILMKALLASGFAR